MPPKIRELKAKLRRSGFEERNAKGSHTRWVHFKFRDLYVTMAGQDGNDAKPYQVDEVGAAIEKALQRLGETSNE
jgi:predicted RNA binding protein YcfA (HicA-like mRNA interferase family)